MGAEFIDHVRKWILYARFDPTNQYMISSLSTSLSPAINKSGGNPPRYEFTGLMRGCDKRLFWV